MVYTTMKKIILNGNNKFNNGEMNAEEYGLLKTDAQNKLDVFYARNRLTQGQYEELSGMLADDQAEGQ